MDLTTTITIIKGTDNTFALTFTDVNGNPVDLTGHTVLFTVKTSQGINEVDPNDNDAIIAATASLNSVPTQGGATIVLSNKDTNIPAGEYLYDIRVVSNAGIITNVQKSAFIVHNPVTNR